MVLKALLALLLALPASAQEWNNACFGGLNDADSPAVLGSCESPSLLNVEANLGGTAILKREGFSLSASLTITTAPVTGSHSFIDSAGNRLDIVCQDTNCAKSTNGNAFATFLTTAASGVTRWSFVDQGGILYGANNKRDPIMRYDGTTRTSPVGMPLGSILELTHDRLAVGDISGLPNRVHFSSAGAYEQFTVGVNPEDSFFDDVGAAGDRIRGIRCVQGACFIFKTASITLYDMGNQYTTQASVVSPNIGTTDPASIVAAGDGLYFRAQDKNYWRIDRSGLVSISKKIPNLVKSQSGGLGGGENSNTQTTQADWVAGVQLPLASWNTATAPGSIFPSSVTLVDTSSSDFAGGTLTSVSTATVGTLTLGTSSFFDNFADGNYTASPVWTASDGNWSAASGALVRGSIATGHIQSTNTVAYGSWSWYMTIPNTAGYESLVFVICSDSAEGSCVGSDGYFIQVNQNSGATANVRIVRQLGSTPYTQTIIAACTTTTTIGSAQAYRVVRNYAGLFSIYIDGTLVSSCTDTTYTTSGIVEARASSSLISYDDFNFSGYNSAGSFVSRAFDTAYSTPTWGPFTVNLSSSVEATATFTTQASNDGVSFETAVAQTPGAKIVAAQRRYVRYNGTFATTISTKSFSISDVSLVAATTGQFRTACIQPNASISAWGTLSCAQTLTGNGSEVFYATSALTCAALPTSHPVNAAGVIQDSWVAQTNNATVTIATNTAVYIGWRSLLGSATDQAQVDACVLSWNEGTASQPSWAAYDSRRNAIYWTSTIDGAAATNRLLKYDLNTGGWFPWNIAAQAPRVINNELYFGGAAAGTWNKYGGVTADAGAAIESFWTSKDVGSDTPFQGKSFKSASVLSKNSGAGNLTATWTLSNAKTGSYTVSLTTGTGISYARSNYLLPFSSPQQFLKLKLGNNSAVPFEVLGIGIKWTVEPWRVEGP